MDRISKERRSWNMSRIKSRDTSLEMRVRRAVFARGYRYRVRSTLPGKPDMVFPGRRIAVFINGCFWHMHGCSLSKIPRTNSEFWKNKLSRNRERDEEVRKKLEGAGWKVIVLWECQINSGTDQGIEPLLKALEQK